MGNWRVIVKNDIRLVKIVLSGKINNNELTFALRRWFCEMLNLQRGQVLALSDIQEVNEEYITSNMTNILEDFESLAISYGKRYARVEKALTPDTDLNSVINNKVNRKFRVFTSEKEAMEWMLTDY